jgi:hypothetical protein
MTDESFLDIPAVIRTYNVSRSFSTAMGMYSATTIAQIPTTDISPTACLGFIVLILATVLGNILVLAALYLDKRLHEPSFFLIANMAIADLLLGKNIFIIN